MLEHPQIDPVALSIGPLFGIGPLEVHWYGLMYVIGFLGFLLIGKYRARKPGSAFTTEQVDDLMFWGAIGVVAGGRVGYMLFYKLNVLAANPMSLFQITDGGMSFHGGLIGVSLAMIILAWRWKLPILTVSDFVAPLVPIGLFAGRIGNFINGELWGRPTDAPWGMVFREAGDMARHPSQLYQAALEGIALFILLNLYRRMSPPTGAITGLFLIGYGIARFLVEFVREPDEHLKNELLFGWMTRGQTLTIPMFMVGGFLIWYAYNKNQHALRAA